MYEASEVALSKLVPFHGVQDRERLAKLTALMRANGYDGRPLLGWESPDGYVRLLTGSHRYAAAKAARLDEVPVALVDLPDGVLEADGEDLCIEGNRITDVEQLEQLLAEHDPEAAELLRHG
ncbi:hypothetical protein F0U60_37550 [Archangium minus]|uniref:ParB-like N-terminal domain-containing protein n=1 Tax=Archangium minus TaxID=83450 RepID=A0ABY9X1C1_9BACT|nr:hypothetical protein F0U60_37550 [Archangium minus]